MNAIDKGIVDSKLKAGQSAYLYTPGAGRAPDVIPTTDTTPDQSRLDNGYTFYTRA